MSPLNTPHISDAPYSEANITSDRIRSSDSQADYSDTGFSIKSLTYEISQKTPFDRSGCVDALIKMGYSRVDIVLAPGEFSIKGDVIDIFSDRHINPIRVDCFGDVIERLTWFNVLNQRSISEVPKVTVFTHTEHNGPVSTSTHVHADTLLLSSLEIGDYVVHELYGIGQYNGLVRLTVSGLEGEYAFLRYKGQDKVFVPINQFKWLTKYVGASKPTLNGLHDGSWKRTQASVQRSAEIWVEALYELYKKRAEQTGFACIEDSEAQLEVEHACEYELTPDQHTALAEIKADMESPHPMDRLLCGEVGFGKTEVFLRAAFKMVDNGKQVAIICPTTILVEQHSATFHSRLKNTGVIIRAISRFQTASEKAHIKQRLKQKKIDILIGTHSLLQKSIVFSDLGLLIIDEEQRFGVDHKEALKAKYPHVDILTVSATPIPRTLYMALTGAKALSQIQTPPQKRQPIYTYIEEKSDKRIQEVLRQEAKRNGQSFYLYNRVATIETKKTRLEKLCPELRFEVLHGQLSERKIQQILTQFLGSAIDVLVCSTIIENGINFPNANTIVIDRVETLGLSQIHQLRGRVGRSDRQGFAYFFYQKKDGLTPLAVKRLAAIRDYTAFGTGYQLAVKDLEIRGAGSLLGKKQHGHITAVGFDLYCKVMEMAMKKRQGISVKSAPLLILDPAYKASFPETYIPNERERMALYRRLSEVEKRHQVDQISEELKDRFGKIPSAVRDFLTSVKVQLP